MSNLKQLGEIYITFFKLGCISFGGGYAMISLIEGEVVEKKRWIDQEKIVDIFSISGSLPGAIALNASAFVGYSVRGIPGAISALTGNLTPSIVIVMLLTAFYMQISDYPVVKSALMGIYPAILGLILFAAFKIGKTALKDIPCVIIMLLAFLSVAFLKLPMIPVIIAGALAGIIILQVRVFLAVRKQKITAEREDKGK